MPRLTGGEAAENCPIATTERRQAVLKRPSCISHLAESLFSGSQSAAEMLQGFRPCQESCFLFPGQQLAQAGGHPGSQVAMGLLSRYRIE
jgi:hypothetical protein